MNEARHLLAHARDFAQTAEALGDNLRGEIWLGCFLTIGPRFMPALLAPFAEVQPGITVKLEEGDQREILDGILSGRLEIAVSYDYAVPEDVSGELLIDLPPLLVLAADHPLAGRSVVSLKDGPTSLSCSMTCPTRATISSRCSMPPASPRASPIARGPMS